jgi:hypothetical protein
MYQNQLYLFFGWRYFGKNNGNKPINKCGVAVMKNDNVTSDILSRKEAAEYLGICRATLDRLDIPRTRIRHRVMFKRDILNKWIDDHTEKNKGNKK